MDVSFFAKSVGGTLDVLGILVILGGFIISTAFLILRLFENQKGSYYKTYRQSLGKSILLGLEFLIVGDIVRTVAGDPGFVDIGILVLIVLIRSFLGITFEMELEGRLPWQKGNRNNV